MGCHPMLTENANFVTNTLRGDLSTVIVRPRCGHHTFSVHQLITNLILLQFDSRMARLEAEIPSPLYVTGVYASFGVDGGCCPFLLCMDVVKVMVVREVILKKKLLPFGHCPKVALTPPSLCPYMLTLRRTLRVTKPL